MTHLADLERWLSADPASYGRWIELLGQRRFRDDRSAGTLRALVSAMLLDLRQGRLAAFACGEALQVCLSDLLLLEQLGATDVPAAAIDVLRQELPASSVDLVHRLLRNLSVRGMAAAGPARPLADGLGLPRPLAHAVDADAIELVASDPEEPVLVVITAGRGTRLRSTIPKGLIPLGGTPMIQAPIRAATAAGITRRLFILRYGAGAQREYLSQFGAVRVQPSAEGTGHSAFWALTALRDHRGPVVLSYSDTPFLGVTNFARLLDPPVTAEEALRLSAYAPAKGEAGRVLRDERGALIGVAQPRLRPGAGSGADEADGGLYSLRRDPAWTALAGSMNANTRREYQFTDVVALLHEAGYQPGLALGPEADFQGVNTPADLVMARLRAETGVLAQTTASDQREATAIISFFSAYGLATTAGSDSGREALAELALRSVSNLIGPVLDLDDAP